MILFSKSFKQDIKQYQINAVRADSTYDSSDNDRKSAFGIFHPVYFYLGRKNKYGSSSGNMKNDPDNNPPYRSVSENGVKENTAHHTDYIYDKMNRHGYISAQRLSSDIAGRECNSCCKSRKKKGASYI